MGLFGRNLVKEGVEAYKRGLTLLLRDGKLDPGEMQQLQFVATKYGLQDQHIRPLHAEVFEQQCAARLADGVLTDQELQELQDLAQQLNLTQADVPSATKAIRQASQAPQQATQPDSSAHSRLSDEEAYWKMVEKSPLEQVTQELAFHTRDWERAWPLINKGLKLVSGGSAREAFRFYTQAGETLYAHREVVDGAQEKAIEIFEAQLEITPLAIIEDAAWWEQYHELSKKHNERMGISYSPSPEHSIPELKLTGLKQLCIIREKQAEYEVAISICDVALQNNWPGDWLIRRNRLQKKLNKSAAK